MWPFKPAHQPDRRAVSFQEWLSKSMMRTAVAGAAYVLIDPKMTITDQAIAFVMNSGAFSSDTKGLIVGAILVGGYNSIREFWLGTSKGGQDAAQAMARVAEAAPTAVAKAAETVAAVAPSAANGTTTSAERVDVVAEEVTVTGKDKSPET
jgi:hypothetical protein